MEHDQQIKTSPTHHYYQETISQDMSNDSFLGNLSDSLVTESKPNVNRALDFGKPSHAWWRVDQKPIRGQTVTAHRRNKLKPDQSCSVHAHRQPLKEKAWRAQAWLLEKLHLLNTPPSFCHKNSHHLPYGNCDDNPALSTHGGASPLLCPLAMILREANPGCEETLDHNLILMSSLSSIIISDKKWTVFASNFSHIITTSEIFVWEQSGISKS